MYKTKAMLMEEYKELKEEYKRLTALRLDLNKEAKEMPEGPAKEKAKELTKTANKLIEGIDLWVNMNYTRDTMIEAVDTAENNLEAAAKVLAKYTKLLECPLYELKTAGSLENRKVIYQEVHNNTDETMDRAIKSIEKPGTYYLCKAGRSIAKITIDIMTFRYELRLRDAGPGCQPSDFVNKTYPRTLYYNRKLTEAEIDQYDMSFKGAYPLSRKILMLEFD